MSDRRLRHAPVVIQLRPTEVYKADLLKELRVDRTRIDRELLHQPGKYAWWASLSAQVAATVSELEEKLEHLEAKLSKERRARGKPIRVGDMKMGFWDSTRYRKLRAKLRHWEDSARFLEKSERAFQQRASMLQSFNANMRKEREQS